MKPWVSSVVAVRRTAAHRQPRDAHAHTLVLCLAFAQSDPSQWRLGEHAIGHQTAARAAVGTGQIVPGDPKIVDRDVSKLRAAGALADRPDIGRRRLQPVIDTDIAVCVQLDAGFLKPDAGGIGNAPCRGQDVAALDLLLARRRAHRQADAVARSALDSEGLRLEEKLNAFFSQNSVHFIDDVGILAGHQLSTGLDHGHAAPKAAIGLRHLRPT
jgi:hypothetical protein